jgi:hypothetical protein
MAFKKHRRNENIGKKKHYSGAMKLRDYLEKIGPYLM